MSNRVTAEQLEELRPAASDPLTAQAQANALAASAREHKVAAGWNRRRAQEARQKLDAFLAMCEEHGIEVVFEDLPDDGGAPASGAPPSVLDTPGGDLAREAQEASIHDTQSEGGQSAPSSQKQIAQTS